jgi:hypothetical protein
MGYVGNQSTNAYSSLPAKQDLTGATGTTLTLSHAVAGPESIDLFINNVRQEPTTAYSVSDTTVTLTGSVVATDDIYVVYNGLALQTIVPPDGSVTSAKLDTNIEVSGILTEPNKEYFQVDLTTTQSGIVDGAHAVVDFNTNGTVKYDTKSNFDASTNSYELDSSDGVYWVEYSLAITSDTAGTAELITSTSAAEFSTDNFSSINSRISEFTRSLNAADALEVSHHHKRSTIFKATSSGTKIRLKASSNPSGNQASTYRFAHNISTQSSFTNFDGVVTSLSVVRIA